MNPFLTLIAAALFLYGVWATVKLLLMRSAADELRTGFTERLADDTNTLIGITSCDRRMLMLCDALNAQLRVLRSERQRNRRGDAELKEAVTNIAHDLRTPLTAISGYLQLLEREDKSANAERYITLIANRAAAMKSLTEELFDYSVITGERELTIRRTAINDALEESLAAAYAELTSRAITPEISICEEKAERDLDRSALRRVFDNIISNAVKYSDGDFRVALTADGTVEFSNSARRLDSVTAGRLFDRFYTVETGRRSTGLGLAIAKQLTERMGGEITADYRDGRLYIRVTFRENT